MKTWGGKEFWGCGSDYDPDWVLTTKQKELRDKLIELCRTTIRPKAAECDRDYKYPRESLDSLASLGLLGLVVPKELGGLGENHVCCAMVVETIARYGCPSTALVYSMHLLTTSMLLCRYHDNPTFVQLLKDINEKKLIGTSVHSDPATGGHFWYSLTCKAQQVSPNMVRYLKYGSWATSAGYADFYAVCSLSPDHGGDPANLVVYLCYKNEIRAFSQEWSAMGMHGNMSGEIVVDAVLPTSRIVGKHGDGTKVNEEGAAPMFMVATAGCWVGIAMACMDVAKRHVTKKTHADQGLRICDYPAIQDYFGRSMSDTNSCRMFLYGICAQMDKATNNNDWMPTSKEWAQPRTAFNIWLWQVKHSTSENAGAVSDLMMKACGGAGYKTEMGLERLLRDSKAGSLMAINSEVIRSLLGQAVLLGPEHLDLWCQSVNQRVLGQELSKMKAEEKKALAKKLLEEAELECQAPTTPAYDDFDNPFSTGPPKYLGKVFTSKGREETSALAPSSWTSLTLQGKTALTSKMTSFSFRLPKGATHSGLLPGQYVKVRVQTPSDGAHERFFSPVSVPSSPDCLELVLRFESYGIVSDFFRRLEIGDSIECQGPSGGFEYSANTATEVTLLASGGGITPGLQLIRAAMADTQDNTKLKLIYYSDSEEDVLYRTELEDYAANDKFSLVLSLGEPPADWPGEEGFIDRALIDKHVSKDSTCKHKVIVCGGPNMSLTCCHALKELGFKSEQIFIFGHFGREQIMRAFGRNTALSGHTL